MAPSDPDMLLAVVRNSLHERRDTILFSNGVRLWFYGEAQQYIVDEDGTHHRHESIEDAIGHVWELTCAPTEEG